MTSSTFPLRAATRSAARPLLFAAAALGLASVSAQEESFDFGAPTDLRAVSYDNGIVLFWEPPQDPEFADVTRPRYKVSIDGGEPQFVPHSDVDNRAFKDAPVEPLTERTYEVFGTDFSGNQITESANISAATLAAGAGIETWRLTAGETPTAHLARHPTLSGDGRFVAYTKRLPNNLDEQIERLDLETGETTLISRNADGELADDDCLQPTMSAGGRFIAFLSEASNLADGNTSRRQNVYLYDALEDTLRLVTAGAEGSGANADARHLQISADGSTVGFLSNATNLLDEPLESEPRLFLYDNASDTLQALPNDEENDSFFSEPQGAPTAFALSGDGSLILKAMEYPPSNTLFRPDDVLWAIDLNEGTRTRLTPSSGNLSSPVLTPDGRYAAFGWSANINDTQARIIPSNHNNPNIYVYDFETETYAFAGLAPDESVPTFVSNSFSVNGFSPVSDLPDIAISDDARFVFFVSPLGRYGIHDTNSRFDVFVRDRDRNRVVRVSRSSEGEEGDGNSGRTSASDGNRIAIAGDGSAVVYASQASNLVPDDDNGARMDIFLAELDLGSADASPPLWPEGSELRADETSATLATLSWTPAEDPEGNLAGYRIYQDGEPVAELPAVQASHTVTGLDPETAYRFRVEAFDLAGNESQDGPELEILTGSLGGGDVGLAANPAPGGAVELGWDPAEEAVEAYLVQRRDAAGDAWETLAGLPADATSYADESLPAETAFAYRVLLLPEGEAEPRVHTQTAETTTLALFLDEAEADFPAVNRFSTFLPIEGEIALQARGEPRRQAEARIDYLVWESDTPPPEAAPSEAQAVISLSSDADNSDVYTGSWTLPPRTAAVQTIDVRLSDGFGAERVLPVAGLPRQVEAQAAISVAAPDGFGILRKIQATLRSDSLQSGGARVFAEPGTARFLGLPASNDYRFRILLDGLEERNEPNFALRRGLVRQLEHVAQPPPQPRFDIVDFEGKPIPGARLTLADPATNRVLASEIADNKGIVRPWAGQTVVLDNPVVQFRLTRLPSWRLGKTRGEISIPFGTSTHTIEAPPFELFFEPGILRGSVVDEEGEPVAGAEVFISSLEFGVEESFRTRSDESGLFVYEEAFGRNEVVVRALIDGRFAQAQAVVDVPSSGTAEAEFALKRPTLQTVSVSRLALVDPTGDTRRFAPFEEPDLIESIELRLLREGELFSNARTRGRDGRLEVEGRFFEGETFTVVVDATRLGFGLASFPLVTDPERPRIELEEVALSMDSEAFVQATLLGTDGRPLDNAASWQATVQSADERFADRHKGRGPTLILPAFETGPTSLVVKAGHQVRAIEALVEPGANDLGELRLLDRPRFGSRSISAFSATPGAVAPRNALSVSLAPRNGLRSPVENLRLRLELPEGVAFDPGSLLVEGEAATPDIDEQGLSVPLGNLDRHEAKRAFLHLNVAEDIAAQTFELLAWIEYEDRTGSRRDLLGVSRHDVVVEPTIFAPEAIGDRVVEVYGRAPQGKVIVYDDGAPIGQATVSEAGYWRQTVELNEPKTPHWHALVAKWISPDGEQERRSTPTDVLRHPQATRPLSVRFRQRTDEADQPHEVQLAGRFPKAGQWAEFEVPETGPARFWRQMLAGFPFEFEIGFSDPAAAEDVVVQVEGSAGGRAEARLDPDGVHRARIETARDADWIAGPISVSWTPVGNDRYPKWANGIRAVGEFEALEPEEEALEPASGQPPQAGTNGVADHRYRWRFEDPGVQEGQATVDLSSGRSLVSPSPSVSFDGERIEYSAASAPMFDASADFSYANNRILATVTGFIPIERFAQRDRRAPWFLDDAELVATEAGEDSLVLSWTNGWDDNWVESYAIYRDGERVETVEGDALEAAIDGLTSGQTYAIAVRAVDPTDKESAQALELTVAFEGADTDVSPEPAAASEIEVAGVGAFRVEQTVASAGSFVKTSTNAFSTFLGPAADVIGVAKDIYDQEEQFERWEEMKDAVEACDSVIPSDRDFLDERIEDAAVALVARNMLSTAFASGSVGFAATGVGAPASAALAVAGTGVGFIAGDIADLKMRSVEEAFRDIMDANPDCDDPDDGEDDDGSSSSSSSRSSRTVADPTWKIDPSGFVFEVLEENRLEGVVATIYTGETENGPWVPWDAENFGEINPQSTDAGGRYRWDVPAGWWLVEYKKNGFETAFSDPLPVPPPHFDVNIPLKSLEPPAVESVEALPQGRGVRIVFSTYMRLVTLGEGSTALQDADGAVVPGSLRVADADKVANPHTESTDLELAKRAVFVPEAPLEIGAAYVVSVASAAESYAGIPLGADFEQTIEVRAAPQGAYFGAFDGAPGHWALIVRDDGQAAFFGVDPQSGKAIEGTGEANLETGEIAIALPCLGEGTALSGAAENGAFSGEIDGAGFVLTGERSEGDIATPETASVYEGVALFSQDTRVRAIAANDDLLLTVSGELAQGSATGSLDADRRWSGDLSDGAAVSVALGSDGSLSGSLEPPEAGSWELAGRDLEADPHAQLVNISGRGLVSGGEDVLIAGFVAVGDAPKPILVRSAGPSLSRLDVEGALERPRLRLFDPQRQLLSETQDWRQQPEPLEDVLALFDSLGAFPFEMDAPDASLFEAFEPQPYTAVVDSASSQPGIALAEIYDGDPEALSARTNRIVNLSVRGVVGSGEGVLIAGFVVEGNRPLRVLLRGVGPSLTTVAPIERPAHDPRLRLFAKQIEMDANDDWEDFLEQGDLADLFQQLGAFALERGSADAAMALWLPPGIYTVHLDDLERADGIGLIEIYLAQ